MGSPNVLRRVAASHWPGRLVRFWREERGDATMETALILAFIVLPLGSLCWVALRVMGAYLELIGRLVALPFP